MSFTSSSRWVVTLSFRQFFERSRVSTTLERFRILSWFLRNLKFLSPFCSFLASKLRFSSFSELFRALKALNSGFWCQFRFKCLLSSNLICLKEICSKILLFILKFLHCDSVLKKNASTRIRELNCHPEKKYQTASQKTHL